jgi:tetratricopeptide (TPR) repeat protein/transcriptional regulator with XRE-family HTH domain
MKKSQQATPNHLLREARKQHYWTQSQVAEQLDTTVVNVNRWESGTTTPSLYFRQKLCELFGKSPEELGLISATEKQEQAAAIVSPSHQVLWNVPFRRNPYFTGRQSVLGRLETVLQKGTPAALVQTQAISGLGGIGKTQTAVEYAYRHQSDYQAVLWAKADSRELLTADFVELAALLELPEKDEPDQSQAVEAVKGWLKEYPDWLLILDNVEDLDLAGDFLPSSSQGHILLTTRRQSTGRLARRIDLEQMEPQEGALLLLRRAKRLEPTASMEQAPAAERAQALELAGLLDGLPLALDQAAAYIEETECGLAGYLSRYRTRSGKLLQLRGGGAVSDHPEAVAKTWSLSFEKVQQANPAAADLLRVCAFLHPDAIAEEIITQGATELGPILAPMADDPLELDAAIRDLRTYSLVRRDPEAHLLQVHRLVQAVLKDNMEDQTQRQWAERVVRAVNRVFPEVDFSTWPLCHRYLPHALACAELVEQWNLTFPEVARLFDHAGNYLEKRGQYAQAESLYQLALRIREKTLEPGHLELARSFCDIAGLYYLQQKNDQAALLFQRALMIREQALGPEHPEVADVLNDLANVYLQQANYSSAEPLLQRALDIRERCLGPEHPAVANTLNDLGAAYENQGQYIESESLHLRSLAIREKALGPEHPDVAVDLNNLAVLYHHQGKYEQAEPFYQRAITIDEKTLGPEHPDLAVDLSNLATLYRVQGKYTEAEPLCKRALMIWEKALGPEYPGSAYALDTLAYVYAHQGDFAQAESLFKRAQEIREQALGPEHLMVARSLFYLAELYCTQGKYTQAEPLYQRALHIREQVLGPQHPDVAVVLEKYADLLRKANLEEEAAQLVDRYQTFQTKHSQTPSL